MNGPRCATRSGYRMTSNSLAIRSLPIERPEHRLLSAAPHSMHFEGSSLPTTARSRSAKRSEAHAGGRPDTVRQPSSQPVDRLYATSYLTG